MISADVTLADLLDAEPALLEVLVAVHPHFGQLRDPAFRRLMAPRVTVAEAARIAGVPTDALLARLSRATGAGVPPARPGTEARGQAPPDAPRPRPPVLDTLRAIDVDVRDDLRRGQEPFAKIMGAVKALGAGEALVLRAPFEPVPLYDVLGGRGFAHWTERHADTDWSVWFYRDPAATTPAASGTPAAAEITLDVRGLEPPQPMVVVLERLDTLAPDQTLVVVHDRRPVFLYPQLEDRGFRHETAEPVPRVVRIRIWRDPARAGDGGA